MKDLVPQNAVDAVAKRIRERASINYYIPTIGHAANLETPQYFEIMPFTDVDKPPCRFFAIDGSQNHHTFYNGISLALYRAGYLCYQYGKPQCVNDANDPFNLAQLYTPENTLVLRESDIGQMYDELLSLPPVAAFLSFCDDEPDVVFAYKKEAAVRTLSTFLGFAQQVLEWSLVYEIATRPEIQSGDYILRDGTLRPLEIKQQYIVKLGAYVKEKGMRLLAVTKQSPVKMELSYTFTQIDNYLQDTLKHNYGFTNPSGNDRKLCAFLEVPESVLLGAYGSGAQFIKKSITGGRGCGLFFAARLDYVEKLQNYDWLLIDLNIFDVIPGIEQKNLTRSLELVKSIMYDLTALTQEHYILGYPYPLADVHNTVTIPAVLKDELVARVKTSLYETAHLDHTEIENFFLDTHNRF